MKRCALLFFANHSSHQLGVANPHTVVRDDDASIGRPRRNRTLRLPLKVAVPIVWARTRSEVRQREPSWAATALFPALGYTK